MLIERIGSGINVAPIQWALRKHLHLWDEFTDRTAPADSPHHGLRDIWARFVPRGTQGTTCEWYPSAEVLGVKPLCLDLMRSINGTELGGVLITKIPPGAECKPHVDTGWHAERFEKFAIQIESAPGQLFCFDGVELETAPGDLFTFDNSKSHWVKNPTTHDRVTMVVCIRRS